MRYVRQKSLAQSLELSNCNAGVRSMDIVEERYGLLCHRIQEVEKMGKCGVEI